MDIQYLKYPIGQYQKPERMTKKHIELYISDIARLPQKLSHAVMSLKSNQLDTPYRPGGWTIRQVIHHIPESHMNAYIRFKLALTEVNPAIRPYFEDRWAAIADTEFIPIENSINLLAALHERWVILLHTLSEKDLCKTFMHPEHGTQFMLDETIGIYAWHGNHHLAHIEKLKERNNW